MGSQQQAASPLFDRVARVAFVFLVMNYAAVAGLVAAITRRRVWR
jgi:hypothetical protein